MTESEYPTAESGYPMAARLGPMQQRVLDVLGFRWDMPPTAREMAPHVYVPYRDPHRARPTAEAENVASILRRLAQRGLVERLGVAAGGGRCWALSVSGAAVLDEIRRGEAP